MARKRQLELTGPPTCRVTQPLTPARPHAAPYCAHSSYDCKSTLGARLVTRHIPVTVYVPVWSRVRAVHVVFGPQVEANRILMDDPVDRKHVQGVIRVHRCRAVVREAPTWRHTVVFWGELVTVARADCISPALQAVGGHGRHDRRDLPSSLSSVFVVVDVVSWVFSGDTQRLSALCRSRGDRRVGACKWRTDRWSQRPCCAASPRRRLRATYSSLDSRSLVGTTRGACSGRGLGDGSEG